MTSDRDLDTTMHAWLQESPPGPPDRNAVHARVLDRLPQTQQRRHWWSARWNRIAEGATRSAGVAGPRPRWRYMTMFGTTRLIAAIAAFALGGGLLLAGGNLALDDLPAAPTGDATVTPTPFAHFTGETRIRTDETEEVSTWTNDLSDPRLSGTVTSRDSIDSVEAPGGGYLWSLASSGELTNDGGSFSVECTGAGTLGYVRDVGSGGHVSCWYVGQDGYEGLTAYSILSSKIPPVLWTVEGWIFPGTPPSME